MNHINENGGSSSTSSNDSEREEDYEVAKIKAFTVSELER